MVYTKTFQEAESRKTACRGYIRNGFNEAERRMGWYI